MTSSKCSLLRTRALRICSLCEEKIINIIVFIDVRIKKMSFKANDLQTIVECSSYFGFQLHSVRRNERIKRFGAKYAAKISLFIDARRPNSHACLLCSHCFLCPCF